MQYLHMLWFIIFGCHGEMYLKYALISGCCVCLVIPSNSTTNPLPGESPKTKGYVSIACGTLQDTGSCIVSLCTRVNIRFWSVVSW